MAARASAEPADANFTEAGGGASAIDAASPGNLDWDCYVGPKVTGDHTTASFNLNALLNRISHSLNEQGEDLAIAGANMVAWKP